MRATIAVIPMLENRSTIVPAKLQIAPLRTLAANDRGFLGPDGRNRGAVAIALGGGFMTEDHREQLAPCRASQRDDVAR